MGVAVTFDYNTWRTRYPEFANVSEPLATLYFNEAALYHKNDGSGPVQESNTQLMLMNMVTAHVAKLNAPRRDGAEAPDIVGRITDASEGSVSASADYGDTIGQQQAFFLQTKYGAAYWAATRAYRMARYKAPRRRRFNIGPFG